MKLMEVKNVWKAYHQGGIFYGKKKVSVLEDVSLSIESGMCLGLLGRSGAGKSTLGRIVLHLEKQDKGAVCFRGTPLAALSTSDYRIYRRNVQVVFQNSLGSVNPRFTAGRIISEPLQNFETLSIKALNTKIAELLEQVGLDPLDAEKHPHQFSGGELQRVCIARALALTPKLIVLDEAVSSLDMLVQAKIIDLLNTLKKTTGTAFLFISHDIRVLVNMADTLAVLSEGRIVSTLDTKNPDQQPFHPALQELIGSILPQNPVSPRTEWVETEAEDDGHYAQPETYAEDCPCEC